MYLASNRVEQNWISTLTFFKTASSNWASFMDPSAFNTTFNTIVVLGTRTGPVLLRVRTHQLLLDWLVIIYIILSNNLNELITWTDKLFLIVTRKIIPPYHYNRSTRFFSLAIGLPIVPESQCQVTLIRPFPWISIQTNPPVWLTCHFYDCFLLLLASHASQISIFLPALSLSWRPVHRDSNWNVCIGGLWNNTEKEFF